MPPRDSESILLKIDADISDAKRKLAQLGKEAERTAGNIERRFAKVLGPGNTGDKIRITTNRKTGKKVDSSDLQQAGVTTAAAGIGALAVPGGLPAGVVLMGSGLGAIALGSLANGRDETVSRVFTLNEALETFRENQEKANRLVEQAREGFVSADGAILDTTKLYKGYNDALSENRAIVAGVLNARANLSAKVDVFRPLSGEFFPNTPMAAEALRNLQATEKVLREIASTAKDPAILRLLSLLQGRIPKAGPSAPSFGGLGRPLSDDRIRPGFSGGGFLGGGAGNDVLAGGAGRDVRLIPASFGDTGLDDLNRELADAGWRVKDLSTGFKEAEVAAGDFGAETRSLLGPLGESNLFFDRQVDLLGRLGDLVPGLGDELGVLIRGTAGDTRGLTRAVEGLGVSFLKSFGAAIAEGKSLSDVLKGLLDDILRIVTNIPQSGGGGLFGAILGGIGSFFGGLGGGSTSSAPASTPVFSTPTIAVAKGGVFDKGKLQRFAAGGVLGRPALFPFADGVGLAGEAGPEAIMPLARLSGGKLGVRASLPRIPDVPAQPAAQGPVIQNQFFIDARGADLAAIQRLERVVQRLDGSIERRAVGAVMSSRRRGGNIARAFGAR